MSAIASDAVIIVTPVYEDAEACSKLFMELARVLGSNRTYIVAVDDGSVNQLLDITSMEKAGLDGVIIRLKCNVGNQRAIAIGLGYVTEHINNSHRVVIMDSDGEDVPSTIPELLTLLEEDVVDIVVAKRKNRFETLRFRMFYNLYKFIFLILAGKKIYFGNFMALKPAAIRRLTAMQEIWIHIAATVLTSKLRIHVSPLDRGPRYAGTSKMNFVGLALHGFKGLMVFAEDVLVRVGIACGFIASVSVMAIITAFILKFSGFATPGWFSVVVGILFLVFLQTGALTLMTLMLKGIVKSGVPAPVPASYKEFVDRIIYADCNAKN